MRHNDIKGENFLVKIDSNGKPRADLGDFGLESHIGGTPIFASPEACVGTIVGKSDLYSLGMLFLYLITDKETFATFLSATIESKSDLQGMRKLLDEIGVMKIIVEMIHPLPRWRPNLAEIKDYLMKLKSGDFNQITLESVNDLVKYSESDMVKHLKERVSHLRYLPPR